MLNKPEESLASLKKTEELLKDDFSKRNLSDAIINFILQEIKRMVPLQENFGKAADETKLKMKTQKTKSIAQPKISTQKYKEQGKQKIEMLKNPQQKKQTSERKNNTKKY